MNTKIIQPSGNLIEGILPLLQPEGMDYSRNLVVFPGQRPAHFLRKALARKVGSSFIPPVIHSMDSFISYVYEFSEQRRMIETIDAVAVLYDIHKTSPRPIGGKGFMNLDSFFPLGIRIFRDIEELLIEDIPYSKVREIDQYAVETIPEQSLFRLQSLSYFYKFFYEKINENGFSTRASRYKHASEKIADLMNEGFSKRIFAGFFALTNTEKTLFKKMAEDQQTTFIFQNGRGLAEKLKDMDVKIGQETESAVPELHFYSSPDTHGQVYALGSILEGQESLNEDTAVVLPSSDALFPLLRHGLYEVSEDTYNISMGYPLQRTPIFGFLGNLMELAGSSDGDLIYLPSYLNFVLHPYTKNIFYKASAEATRILFHTIEEELSRSSTRTFISLKEIEDSDEIFRNVVKLTASSGETLVEEEMREHLASIHRNTIRQFLSFSSVKDFAERCRRLLVYIYNNSSARLHPLFHPFLESFMNALDRISGSLLMDYSFTNRDSYFSLFKKYIAFCHLPFDGTPVRGLQILGFLETRNLKFDRVFILNANEETLPDTKKDDSLIPFKARRYLALPTYKDRDKLSAYYFDILIKSSKEAHLFFIESDTHEKSRFVERLIWDKQKKDKTKDDEGFINPVQYRVNLANTMPKEIPKTDDVINFLKSRAFSATSLDTYLGCSLKFYYSDVLQISRKEDISGELSRMDIGNSVHHILRVFFSERIGRVLTEADLNIDEMNAEVERHFRKEYGGDLKGGRYLLEQQVRKRMCELLTKYYLPLIEKSPVTIIACEHKESAVIESFNLKGRFDSIEKRGDKIWIIDFKTGASSRYLDINPEKLDFDNRETWNSAIGSLQLPFYLMLYSEKTGMSIDNLSAAYLLIGRSLINRDIELAPFKNRNINEGYTLLKDIILSLLSEIIDEAVPFRPAQDMKHACPPCDFRYICGTQWIASKK